MNARDAEMIGYVIRQHTEPLEKRIKELESIVLNKDCEHVYSATSKSFGDATGKCVKCGKYL